MTLSPNPLHTQSDPLNTQKPRDVLGLIAILVSVLGGILGCVFGAGLINWCVLALGFLCGLIALAVSKGTGALGAAAMFLALVGTVLTTIATLTFHSADPADPVPEAAPTTPTPDLKDAPPPQDNHIMDGRETVELDLDGGRYDAIAEGEPGSHTAPIEPGVVARSGDWSLLVTDINMDANEDVAAASPKNDKPQEGRKYITFTYTMRYEGTEEAAKASAAIVYQDPDGELRDDHHLHSFDGYFSTYYPFRPGETRSGAIVATVPEDNPYDGRIEAYLPNTVTPVYFSLGDKPFTA
ncbi:MAG: hypothetical protein DI609_02935 [Corynebacterium urealyticum]|uniref:DUF4352 domain-containing protein n=1 Tax=Corynebacterium urealyticum TaxID=43771 RepID=A0A2W5B9N5_9CORY|nr:MAG: hypothetical protein DI609_02935 [Corynebacterium urealyticum]